jgi:hypothetical protein
VSAAAVWQDDCSVLQPLTLLHVTPPAWRTCPPPPPHTHPLCCACWKEGQHQCEGADEEAWQRVDDGYLLKYLARVVEGGEEADVAVADLCRVVYKQVWEAV